MAHSLAILCVSLLIVGATTLLTPRVTPPGGLVATDYLLMCLLPLAAYFAGRRWYKCLVFAFYGATGILVFVPGFLADGRLGLKYEYGTAAPVAHIMGWTGGIFIMACLTSLIGREAARSKAESGDESPHSEAD